MSPQPMPSARISMSLCSLWKSSTIAFTAARVAGFGSVSHIVTAIFFWAVARRGAATTAAPAASVVRNSRRPSVPSFRSVTSRWRPAVSRRPMVVLLVATPSGAAVGRQLTRALGLGRGEPEALVEGRPVTLDEVRREPDLLLAVKRAIDRDRRAGRFLLTGSANLLLMRGVSESLAGRASYLTLWPMVRREQRGLGRCGLWEELLGAKDSEWLDLLRADRTGHEDWIELARRGGFPTPAVHLSTVAERAV